MMRFRFRQLILISILSLIFQACASGRVKLRIDPRQLLLQTCGHEKSKTWNHAVSGSLWMKVEAPGESGQFPAVAIARPDGTLQMQVQNLLGGTEATVQVTPKHYSMRSPRLPGGGRSGRKTWMGVPLLWASLLFRGGVPCPDLDRLTELRVVDGEELLVRVPLEEYRYAFILNEGKYWPTRLNWKSTRLEREAEIEFNFELPDEKTATHQKWEAESSFGKVKVNWRNRRLLD